MALIDELLKKKEDKAQIVKFEKFNCQPCRMVSEFFEREGVKIVPVNVQEPENIDLAIEMDIMSVPVTILYVDGKEVKRTHGYNEGQLEEIVELSKQ